MQSFQGKNVIMTGATGGIGSKVAKKLLKAGKLGIKLIDYFKFIYLFDDIFQ